MSIASHLLPALILLASVLVWQYFEVSLLFSEHHILVTSDSNIEVVIGVLSARQNFLERQALRDTWIGHAENHVNVLIKFIVGNDACAIPPDYRRSLFGCESSNFTIGDVEVTAISTSPSSERVRVPVSPPNRISFRVHHPILFQRLGLFWEKGSVIRSTYSVTLFDNINKVEVAKVDFTDSNQGYRVGDYLFKPTESFILPKDFEGSVVVTSDDPEVRWMSAPRRPVSMETGGNVISYFQDTWTNPIAEDLPFQKNGAPGEIASNFMFVIHEVEELHHLIAQRGEETMEWKAEMLRVEKRLEEEMQIHGDIVLVDAMETYRNIPLKMMLFHEWMSDNIKHFKYFLKTDDDCFLNLPLILKELGNDILPSEETVWWGNFRYNWGVDRQGKWAEIDYPSTAYPAFACGSGNLVSADIVHWIATNNKYLHLYQGEDVTMAIWMAAILPTYSDDKRWICDDGCTPGMLASAEHMPEEIRQLWSNLNGCGDPCECEYEPP